MSNKLEEKLTIVSPIRLAHPRHMKQAKETINTFYGSLAGARPRHLIAASIPVQSYYQEFLKSLDSVKAKVGFTSTNTHALTGFIQMLSAVQTEYVFLLLGDVKTMTTKDFMTPCVEAMDKDPKLMQIRIAGYPFSNGTTNTAYLYSDGKNVCFDGDKSIAFERIGVGGDTVWTVSTLPEKQKFFYAIPMWSTVMRTSYIKQLIGAVQPHLAGRKTLTNLSELLNGAEDLVRYNLTNDGWPTHLKFMNDYKQGSLNLSCYMYAFDREEKTQLQFLKEQMNEVKDVPPEGKL